jgi:hypothetical protein
MMSNSKGYLTVEFWATIVTAVAMVVVTLGVASQEEVDAWVAMLVGLVTAVLPIVIYITGASQVRAVATVRGLLPADSKLLTVEFWMTLLTTLAMILVALRVFSQAEADQWLAMLGPVVAAVLTIAAYIRGRLEVEGALLA